MLPDLGAAVLFCVSAAFTLNKVIEVPANRLREAWVWRRMYGRATFKLDGAQAASIVVGLSLGIRRAHRLAARRTVEERVASCCLDA